MSSLKTTEKKILEKLFNMEGGYVLSFTDKSFEKFLKDDFNISVYSEMYDLDFPSKSKANRLRGIWSVEDDAKVISAGIDGIRSLGFNKAKLAINDRQNFNDLSIEDIRLIDKMYKIGKDKMPQNLLEFIEKATPTERLQQIFKILESNYKLKEGKDFFFDPTLARGLDYYTSTVFEMKLNGNPEDLSVGGGGRYDNLIGMFAGREIPAVGFSFGIDRIIELTK